MSEDVEFYASRTSTTQFRLRLRVLTPFFIYELMVYATIAKEPGVISPPEYFGRTFSRSSKVFFEKLKLWFLASRIRTWMVLSANIILSRAKGKDLPSSCGLMEAFERPVLLRFFTLVGLTAGANMLDEELARPPYSNDARKYIRKRCIRNE